MSGVALPSELAVSGPINTQQLFRPTEIVEKGPVTRSSMRYFADTYTNQQIGWQGIIPPTEETCIDRQFLVNYQIKVTTLWDQTSSTTIANSPWPALAYYQNKRVLLPPGVTGAPIPAESANMALRPFPMQICAQTQTLTINGSSTTVNSTDTIPLHGLTTDFSESREATSELGVFPTPGYIFDSGDSIIDPIYGDYDIFKKTPTTWVQTVARQRWDIAAAPVAGAANQWTIIWLVTITEPLVISPLRFGRVELDPGLSRITNMSLTLQFGNPNRCLIYAPPAAGLTYGTLVTTYFPGSSTSSIIKFQDSATNSPKRPELQLVFNQPDSILASQMSSYLIYEHYNMMPFITPNVFTSGTSYEAKAMSSSSIRFPYIPQLIMVYVKPSNSFMLSQSTALCVNDHYLTIESINVNFFDRIGLGSTLSAQQLYDLSRKNGFRGSYDDWRYRFGSVLILNPAEDLCLGPQEASGQDTYSNFQISLTANNSVQGYANRFTSAADPTSGTLTYDLYVLALIPSRAVIGGGQCTFVTEGPSQQAVIALLSQAGSQSTSTVGTTMPWVSGGSLNSKGIKRMVPGDGGAVSAGAISAGSVGGGDARRSRIR